MLNKEMSTAKARSKVRLVKSENKWGRSNRRHFSRQNYRKKSSDQYEKKFRNVELSQFRADKWIPCPSGYTRGQGWNCLFRAWLGYKIANNPRNGETIQDKLFWAQMIQNIQTDLGLKRSSFPQLSLAGDVVFAYDIEKELELQDQHDELWFKEYQEKKRVHIQEIVETSFLSEEEKQWLNEGYTTTPANIQQTFDPISRRYVERIVMI